VNNFISTRKKIKIKNPRNSPIFFFKRKGKILVGKKRKEKKKTLTSTTRHDTKKYS